MLEMHLPALVPGEDGRPDDWERSARDLPGYPEGNPCPRRGGNGDGRRSAVATEAEMGGYCGENTSISSTYMFLLM